MSPMYLAVACRTSDWTSAAVVLGAMAFMGFIYWLLFRSRDK